MRLPTVLALLLTLPACSTQPVAHGGFPSRIAVGDRPVAPSAAAGSVWVPNSADGTVTRVDERTGRVLATIQIGDPANLVGRGCLPNGVHAFYSGSFLYRACDMPSAVAATRDAVWVTDGADFAVVRIDPARNRVLARIPIGTVAWGIAADDTQVWVSSYDGDSVIHIDPLDNTIRATLAVPHGPTGIALAATSVWVVCSRERAAVQIDPTFNTVTRQVPLGDNPMEVAVAFGSVWIMNERDGSLMRFDETSGETRAVIPTLAREGRDGLGGIAAFHGGLWMGGIQVQEVDPTTNRVVAVIKQDAVAVGAGISLWGVSATGYLVRLDDRRKLAAG